MVQHLEYLCVMVNGASEISFHPFTGVDLLKLTFRGKKKTFRCFRQNASAFGVKHRGVFLKQLGVFLKGRILFKILVLSARSVQNHNFAATVSW